MIPLALDGGAAHSHCAVVDFDTVELLGRFWSGCRVGKDDSRHTTALSSRAISEKNLLRVSNGLAKVVLIHLSVSGLLRGQIMSSRLHS